MSSLFFCLAIAIGQPVNCFPEDGWFTSADRVFSRPRDVNFTPIAAPAYVYLLVKWINAALGGDPRREFYLGAICHALMLWAAGLLILRASRLHGTGVFGAASAIATVAAIGSTLITQAFWSENTTILLMAASLALLSELACRPDQRAGRWLWLSGLYGVTLGLFTATRVIPIVIQPAACVVIWLTCGTRRAISFTATSSLCLAIVVVGSMWANVYRYGRFELSNSTGFHLWNAILPLADEMLEGSADYAALKRTIPDVQERRFWEIDYRSLPEADRRGRTMNEFLRAISVRAIRDRPLLFLRHGARKTRAYIALFPDRGWAFHRSRDNPLGVDDFLPPLLPALTGLRGPLGIVERIASAAYGTVLVFTVTSLSIATAALCIARPRWRATRLSATDPGRSPDRTVVFGAFLLWVLLTGMYLTMTLEFPQTRYTFPFLPVVALAAGMAASLTASAVTPPSPERTG